MKYLIPEMCDHRIRTAIVRIIRNTSKEYEMDISDRDIMAIHGKLVDAVPKLITEYNDIISTVESAGDKILNVHDILFDVEENKYLYNLAGVLMIHTVMMSDDLSEAVDNYDLMYDLIDALYDEMEEI